MSRFLKYVEMIALAMTIVCFFWGLFSLSALVLSVGLYLFAGGSFALIKAAGLALTICFSLMIPSYTISYLLKD